MSTRHQHSCLLSIVIDNLTYETVHICSVQSTTRYFCSVIIHILLVQIYRSSNVLLKKLKIKFQIKKKVPTLIYVIVLPIFHILRCNKVKRHNKLMFISLLSKSWLTVGNAVSLSHTQLRINPSSFTNIEICSMTVKI